MGRKKGEHAGNQSTGQEKLDTNPDSNPRKQASRTTQTLSSMWVPGLWAWPYFEMRELKGNFVIKKFWLKVVGEGSE